MSVLISSPKKVEPDVQIESPSGVSIRLPKALIGDMKAYFKPKEKSRWVDEAVADLLNRSLYKDADWADPEHSDTVGFISLLSFQERLVEPKGDTLFFQAGTYTDLMEAVARITRLYPSYSSKIRPAIIRAAIRQRMKLGGHLWKDVFAED